MTLYQCSAPLPIGVNAVYAAKCGDGLHIAATNEPPGGNAYRVDRLTAARQTQRETAELRVSDTGGYMQIAVRHLLRAWTIVACTFVFSTGAMAATESVVYSFPIYSYPYAHLLMGSTGNCLLYTSDAADE